MKKSTLMLCICLLLSVALGVGSTLAYLTDRDAETNVFTIGSVDIELEEDFEQGSTLIPGVEIEKKPVITNTGDNDAWVWLTFSVPSALDNFAQGTEQGSNENVIHWNPTGATTEGYVNQNRVDKAIEQGLLPEGTTAADILASNKTWNVFNSLAEGKNAHQEEINGVEYNTYVLLYNKALEPGETTLPSIYNVYLDARVDIDPEGNMYVVEKGQVKDLDWNINEDGAPIIYAAAYAVQKEGFDTVKDAYDAYANQWTNDSDVPVKTQDTLDAVEDNKTHVKDADELFELLANAKEGAVLDLVLDGDIEYVTEGHHGENDITKASAVTIDGQGKYTLTATGSGVTPIGDDTAALTLKNLTVVDESKSYDETAWELSYLEMGGAKLTCSNVEFKDPIMVESETATFKNCSFVGYRDEDAAINMNGVWMYNGDATFTDCTFTGTRGMKICDMYDGGEVGTVVIDDCLFDNLTQKPGVAIDDRDTQDMQITIKNSTFVNCQPGDQSKYIYETDNTVPTLSNNTVK